MTGRAWCAPADQVLAAELAHDFFGKRRAAAVAEGRGIVVEPAPIVGDCIGGGVALQLAGAAWIAPSGRSADIDRVLGHPIALRAPALKAARLAAAHSPISSSVW